MLEPSLARDRRSSLDVDSRLSQRKSVVVHGRVKDRGYVGKKQLENGHWLVLLFRSPTPNWLKLS